MRVLNPKARYEYFIFSTLEAGIKLLGVEVRSIREGRVNLDSSFAKILGKEVFLVNAHIPLTSGVKMEGYDPNRSRKLLLKRSQISSLIGKLSANNAVLVPLAIYDKNNFIKLYLGLGKSKKKFDKRREIKERDQKRRDEQELKGKE